MPLTRKKIHELLYFYLLLLIAASLPLSIYTTSIFLSLLAINWFIEGNFMEKWRRLTSNRALQIFLLIFILQLVGLLWSENLHYGMKLVKIKLPLLAIPVIISTSQSLKLLQLRRIMLLFSLAVFAASLASLMKLAGVLPGDRGGYRELSLFTGHLWFALMVVLSFMFSLYFVLIQRAEISSLERYFYLIQLFWLPVFLVLLKSLTGIIVALGLVCFWLLRMLIVFRRPVYRALLLVAMVIIPLSAYLYMSASVKRFYSLDEHAFEELEAYTIEGNPYEHYPEKKDIENGHYVWQYICDEELEREWNKLSDLDYYGRTANDNSLRTTLIRYLTSRGLRKDATGMMMLSEKEIRAIENGRANHIYNNRFGLYPRIYEVIWEFDRYGKGYSPNEKSIVQRYIYLQTGWSIARDHLLFGVGNGDVLLEYKNFYAENNSALSAKQRRGPHNQYLTELLSFGIAGLVVFLVALIAPIFLAKRQASFLASGVLVLFMISMLSGSSLDGVTGVVFFSLFYSLFLFGPEFPKAHHKGIRKDG